MAAYGPRSDNFVELLNRGCKLFSVETAKATGGVLVDERNVICWTPPYFRFLLGRTVEESRQLVESLYGVHQGD